ncbi:DSD1 family PLP-dependent enzyme [Mesorhizobium sp. 1B3]|uniref:DSD1 family PLP-dependent enzyme n=1 Tax=Mesorhizobium sp. 1B3 TaxID=3243599 RepID=UPI003D980DD0
MIQDLSLRDAEPGFDVPALPGMALHEVQTPALLIDLDALERNLERMRRFVTERGVRLRAHAKTHKSADIARLQMERGGACGICCQKVSEAEAMVRAGITDILVANEVRDPAKLDRLARLAKRARIIVCADDPEAVADLSSAARGAGVTLEVLVEIDCGAGRCGIAPGLPARDLALAIAAAPGLRFAGIQAYHGRAQHLATEAERRCAIVSAEALTRQTVEMIAAAGLTCEIVGGAGTGTYRHEAASGVWNELQCGSYIFMDADYRRVLGPDAGFEHALFVLTSVMSLASGRAVTDAGLKALAVDSGLPAVHSLDGVSCKGLSDEHCQLDDPLGRLRISQRLQLIPGHCDPTCNLYDWYVGIRGDRVETVWPVTARGKLY